MMRLLPKKSRDSLIKQIPFPSRFGNPSEFAELSYMLITNGNYFILIIKAYMNG
jgi:hypothetical protein